MCCPKALSTAWKESASQGCECGETAEQLLVFFSFFPSDYRKKQNALRALQKKALDKNPDEFYFKMIRTELRVRIHITFKQGYTLLL